MITMLNAFSTGWVCGAVIQAVLGVRTTTPITDLITMIVMFLTTGYLVVTRGDSK
jgi:hypothetical protein